MHHITYHTSADLDDDIGTDTGTRSSTHSLNGNGYNHTARVTAKPAPRLKYMPQRYTPAQQSASKYASTFAPRTPATTMQYHSQADVDDDEMQYGLTSPSRPVSNGYTLFQTPPTYRANQRPTPSASVHELGSVPWSSQYTAPRSSAGKQSLLSQLRERATPQIVRAAPVATKQSLGDDDVIDLTDGDDVDTKPVKSQSAAADLYSPCSSPFSPLSPGDGTVGSIRRKRKHETPNGDTINNSDDSVAVNTNVKSEHCNNDDDNNLLTPTHNVKEQYDFQTLQPTPQMLKYQQQYGAMIARELDTLSAHRQARQYEADHLQRVSQTSQQQLAIKRELVDRTEANVQQQRKHEYEALNLRDFSDILDEITAEEEAAYVHPLHAAVLDRLLFDVLRELALCAKKTIPFTAAEDQQATTLLQRTPASSVIADRNNIEVCGKDIVLLRPLAWLNDEVINFYLKLLQERCDLYVKQPKEYERLLPSAALPPRKIWFYNTFFFAKLVGGDADNPSAYNYNTVRRWSKTQKVDILGLDLLITPVHVHGNHWTCAAVDFRKKRFCYYDSLGGGVGNVCNALRRYIQDEAATYKNNKSYDLSQWTDYVPKHLPRQTNGSDCGVFTLTFANYLCDGIPLVPPPFTGAEMPYFRRRIALEIQAQKVI